MKISTLTVAAAFTIGLLASSDTGAEAGTLPDPEGAVVLTVSGAITNSNDAGTARFDRAMLLALPQVEFVTTTIWTEGEHRFEGVALKDLLEAVGATGTALRATALNDYSVELPVSDAVEGGPIVAILMDGAEMSVRDKGPLWIVYPYDSSSAYQTEVIYSRSIWQLDRIEVKE